MNQGITEVKRKESRGRIGLGTTREHLSIANDKDEKGMHVVASTQRHRENRNIRKKAHIGTGHRVTSEYNRIRADDGA